MRTASALLFALLLAPACSSSGGSGADLGTDDASAATDDGGTDDGGTDDGGGCLDPSRFENSDVCTPANECACPDATPLGACTQAGLSCAYFDCSKRCTCLAPENRWLCCGTTTQTCPPVAPVEGNPCCGAPPSCPYACDGRYIKDCACTSQHWVCQKTACQLPDLGPP